MSTHFVAWVTGDAENFSHMPTVSNEAAFPFLRSVHPSNVWSTSLSNYASQMGAGGKKGAGAQRA